MNIKLIAVGLLVLSLFAGGWYVNELRNDKVTLQGAVTQLEADISQQRLLAARDKAALVQAQAALATIQAKARAANKGVQDAYKNDPAARDWSAVPIPDSLLNSLKP